MLEPESFFEREIARFTASLVDTRGGLLDRSVGADVVAPDTMDGSKSLLFMGACFSSLLVLTSARVESGKSSSEAERLI